MHHRESRLKSEPLLAYTSVVHIEETLQETSEESFDPFSKEMDQIANILHPELLKVYKEAIVMVCSPNYIEGVDYKALVGSARFIESLQNINNLENEKREEDDVQSYLKKLSKEHKIKLNESKTFANLLCAFGAQKPALLRLKQEKQHLLDKDFDLPYSIFIPGHEDEMLQQMNIEEEKYLRLQAGIIQRIAYALLLRKSNAISVPNNDKEKRQYESEMNDFYNWINSINEGFNPSENPSTNKNRRNEQLYRGNNGPRRTGLRKSSVLIKGGELSQKSDEAIITKILRNLSEINIQTGLPAKEEPLVIKDLLRISLIFTDVNYNGFWTHEGHQILYDKILKHSKGNIGCTRQRMKNEIVEYVYQLKDTNDRTIEIRTMTLEQALREINDPELGHKNYEVERLGQINPNFYSLDPIIKLLQIHRLQNSQ